MATSRRSPASVMRPLVPRSGGRSPPTLTRARSMSKATRSWSALRSSRPSGASAISPPGMKTSMLPFETVPPNRLFNTHSRGRLAIQCGQSCLMPAVSIRSIAATRLISGEVSDSLISALPSISPSGVAMAMSSTAMRCSNFRKRRKVRASKGSDGSLESVGPARAPFSSSSTPKPRPSAPSKLDKSIMPPASGSVVAAMLRSESTMSIVRRSER
jgi:hypothetical protein